jgi:hypothetical protein
MKRQHGHWFCDHCDDVVFLSYEKITSTNVPCPVCGYLACNFVPARITRNTLGEFWFAKMREAVEHPELFEKRDYEKIYEPD